MSPHTNNPDKLDQLRALGVDVVGRQPVIVAANPHSERYLRVKRERMAHLLEPESLLDADELLERAVGS